MTATHHSNGPKLHGSSNKNSLHLKEEDRKQWVANEHCG